MKKIAIAITIILEIASCRSPHKNLEPQRGMSEMAQEAVKALLEHSDSRPAGDIESLLNELADTLISVMNNSAIDDIESRINAQLLAQYASALCGEHGTAKGIDIAIPVDKFARVLSTWRIRQTDEGINYIKEVPYTTGNGTEDVEDRQMFIIASTIPEKTSVVLLPKDATGGAHFLFAKRLENTPGYDIDNALAIDPCGYKEDARYIVNHFESTAFLKALESYDAIFVVYSDAEGHEESAMVGLDGLHELLNQ